MDGASRPFVTGGRGLGTGPQPLARPAAPVDMSGAPRPRKGERRLQIQRGRDPTPGLLAQAPAQQPPSRKGAGTVLTEGRAGGSGRAESPSPGAPSWSRRRPPSAPARRLGPASPPAARQPPRWPPVPARPRARPGARAHARDPGAQRARALLSLRAQARGARPRRCRPALTGCLGCRSSPPPAPARALLRGLRSPPTRPGCPLQPP